MKGLSVIITVLLVASAQLLAQCLKRAGALPIENRAGVDHLATWRTRGVWERAQFPIALGRAQQLPQVEATQAGLSELRQRFGTDRSPKPFARFACTDLVTANPSLLRF